MICMAELCEVQHDERAASWPALPGFTTPPVDIVARLGELGPEPCLFTMGATGRDRMLDGSQLLARIGGAIRALSAAGFQSGSSATLCAPLGPSFVGATVAVLAMGGYLRLQPEPTSPVGVAPNGNGLTQPGLAARSPWLWLEDSAKPSSFIPLDELADWPDFAGQATSLVSSSSGTVSSGTEMSGFLNLVAWGLRLLNQSNTSGRDVLAVGGSAPYALWSVAIVLAALASQVPLLCVDRAYAQRHPHRTAEQFRAVGVTKVSGLVGSDETIANVATSVP